MENKNERHRHSVKEVSGTGFYQSVKMQNPSSGVRKICKRFVDALRDCQNIQSSLEVYRKQKGRNKKNRL